MSAAAAVNGSPSCHLLICSNSVCANAHITVKLHTCTDDPGGILKSWMRPLNPVCEYAAELLQKEGSKLAGKQEYAKRVAMNLFRYMESFSTAGSSTQLVLPTHALEQWFNKFNDKFQRDPDFLIHEGEKG